MFVCLQSVVMGRYHNIAPSGSFVRCKYEVKVNKILRYGVALTLLC